jgi:cystathionine beta-lyase/cystathionine gamma-synthase
MYKGKSKLTQSVHIGSEGDKLYKGVTTPIFPSSAYDYEVEGHTLYPRYYNTPNQRSIIEKVAALELAEDGIVFSSGMAAIMTAIFGVLKAGDHAIFQHDLYGGTFDAVVTELPRFGIAYTFVTTDPKSFEEAIKPNTKLIYIETPSNPLLKIVDIKAVATLAKQHGITTLIDNTFASPINQNPITLGIDIVAHSGTKYIGGHSDISCGTISTSKALTQQILTSAIHFGGNLDAQACWLVERSLKTIALRVQQQNKNALYLAKHLQNHKKIEQVYYPGLISHPDHALAKAQMPGGFGGMLSFDVKGNAHAFMNNLQLIRRAVSLGGVEATVTSPVKTSHARMSAEDRAKMGVKDNLVRMSAGIEAGEDLLEDIAQALEKI